MGSRMGRVVGRIHVGTAGASPRLRRWTLALVLLGVALLAYPSFGAVGGAPVLAEYADTVIPAPTAATPEPTET